jgi:hypothetical protein
MTTAVMRALHANHRLRASQRQSLRQANCTPAARIRPVDRTPIGSRPWEAGTRISGGESGRGQDKRWRHAPAVSAASAHGLVRHEPTSAVCRATARTGVPTGKPACRLRSAALRYDEWVSIERMSRRASLASAPETPRARKKRRRDHSSTLVLTGIVRAHTIVRARRASESTPTQMAGTGHDQPVSVAGQFAAKRPFRIEPYHRVSGGRDSGGMSSGDRARRQGPRWH